MNLQKIGEKTEKYLMMNLCMSIKKIPIVQLHYLRNMSKLNPACNAFFQQPKKDTKDMTTNVLGGILEVNENTISQSNIFIKGILLIIQSEQHLLLFG